MIRVVVPVVKPYSKSVVIPVMTEMMLNETPKLWMSDQSRLSSCLYPNSRNLPSSLDILRVAVPAFSVSTILDDLRLLVMVGKKRADDSCSGTSRMRGGVNQGLLAKACAANKLKKRSRKS